MRAIDKFILHAVHNLFPLNEYSEGELKKLMAQFKEEADDLNIQISDDQLKAYIERFDSLKNSPKITDKDLRKYNLSKLIKLVTSTKGVEEPEEEADITPDIVYNQNGLIIYNGSKEENCLTFGAGERWCITRGSFGNYRYDDSRKNPTFYLVKDTNLPDSDRKSFFVVVVGNDNTYKASDRSNNDVGGRATEWDRWEGWSFIEQNFPSITGLRSVFKYIPLSTKEKLNQSYKFNPIGVREWAKLPFKAKEQYLVVRKGKELFQDISTDTFVEKYLPKYPQIANTIATNFGIINSITLVKNLDKFSNQDTRSIISNMRDKIDLKYLTLDSIPFEVKKFLVKFDKWDIPKNERIYVTKDNESIIKLTLGEDIRVGLYTEEDDYPNIKLNKRTSRYLLDYPNLDQIPFKNLISLVSDGAIDRSVIDGIIEKAKTDSNSAIIAKDINNKTILIDSNSFVSYKIDGDKVSKVPFDDEEVQEVFTQQKDNEGFQKNALSLLNVRDNIPNTIDKDAFVSLLKSIPADKRIIEWDGRPAVVLTTESPDSPFIVQYLERSTTSLIFTAVYGRSGMDWRQQIRNSPIANGLVYSAWFDYLRSKNLAFSDSNYINAIKNVTSYSGGDIRKAIIGANPPMQAGSALRSVIYNDVPYIVNTANPRTSYSISSTSGKLVVANIPASRVAQILGTAAPAAAAATDTPTTGRRGRPAGVPNAPRQVADTPATPGDINVREEMSAIGLEAAYLRLPRSVFRRLNVNNASRVDPNGDRGASRRNNLLGTSGRVGRVIQVGASKIYIIRLANQQIIASINVQPGNSNYVLTGNEGANRTIALNSPAELLTALQQRDLAEAHQYIVNEYLADHPGHIKEFKELLRKHINEKKNANK
jgi:hypothetical protein